MICVVGVDGAVSDREGLDAPGGVDLSELRDVRPLLYCASRCRNLDESSMACRVGVEVLWVKIEPEFAIGNSRSHVDPKTHCNARAADGDLTVGIF